MPARRRGVACRSVAVLIDCLHNQDPAAKVYIDSDTLTLYVIDHRGDQWAVAVIPERAI